MNQAEAASSIRLLMVEDNEGDAELELRELRRAGLSVTHRVVDEREGFIRAVREFTPEVIVSDFSMPQFDGLSALRLAREIAPDTPFLFVSGTIGEDHAIQALKEGATDYLLKGNLARFPAAVERALTEAKERRERRRAEAGLSRAQAMAKIGHIITGAGGAFESMSENLAELIGVERARLPRDTREWLELVHLDDREAFRRQALEARADGKRRDLDYRLRRGDGWIHLRQVIEPLAAERASPGPAEWFSTIQDITEQKRAEEKFARLSRLYHVLSEINSVLIRARQRADLYREACRIAVEIGMFKLAWIGLADGNTGRVEVVAWQGANPDFINALPAQMEVTDPQEPPLAARAILEKQAVVANDIATDPRVKRRKEALDHGLRSVVVLPLIVSGEAFAVLALYADVPGFFNQEELKSLADLAGDISFALEQIGKQEKLDYLAYFDPLTGLANASLFRERLAQQIAGEPEKLALLLLDVHRFKSVNDTLGRQAGDQLLKEIAQRLQPSTEDPRRVARIGTDLFAIAIPLAHGEDEAARAAEQRLAECFAAPFRLADQDLRLSGRIGIAVYPSDGSHPDALRAHAEAALKKAKAGGEKFLFYAERMSARSAEILSLETRLRHALERSEFVLHYQPKVDLVNRAIVGVEALMRWQSPDRGLVPPNAFIPALEESGLILDAGLWAIEQAARDHRRWGQLGLQAPRVAVNVSAIQLRQRDFVAALEEALGPGAAGAGVDLEITESLLMDDIEATIGKLKQARDLGAVIAIDDFGTGYSSLAYLSKLPVGMLKIDRSFVNAMLAEPDATSIVQTIIGLAHSLRLKVVAEGVETEPQATMLRLLRCDQMQGYLFAKPMPREQLEALLAPAPAGSALTPKK